MRAHGHSQHLNIPDFNVAVMTICLLLLITVDKVEALKRYKFSLAFENSNEEDYATEKFFQSLVAGVC